MTFNEKDTGFRKFLTRRVGWKGAWIPMVTPRLLRSLSTATNPEERAERRLLAIAEKKMSDFRWGVSICGVLGLTVVSALTVGLDTAFLFIFTSGMVRVLWSLGETLIAYICGKPKEDIPLFLKNTERSRDFEETHRVILLEERLAEAGITHEEMKRMSAAMVTSSIAHKAGVAVVHSEEIMSLFNRVQNKGIWLPAPSSRNLETHDEVDNLLPVLRSAGVEMTRA